MPINQASNAFLKKHNLIIWGCGANGEEFLDNFPELAERVTDCVDANNSKQGKLFAGKWKIQSPEILDHKKHNVIVTPSIYKEISNALEQKGFEHGENYCFYTDLIKHNAYVTGRDINIMTSCDEQYAKLVPVQLLSISDNLVDKDHDVHFYLFHSRVTDKTLNFLRSYSEQLSIDFHDVRITDTAPYEELASAGGVWCHEAYYPIGCQQYLPSDIDRILYIDAADVLIIDNIDEFFFSPFFGNSIIATARNFKHSGVGMFQHDISPFDKGDFDIEIHRKVILRHIFNSGSYILNLKKMRQDNVSTSDFIALKNKLQGIYPNQERLYAGDQGILGAYYCGDIKFFDFPHVKDVRYMPYNFAPLFFYRSALRNEEHLWYTPKIIHYAGPKPWNFTRYHSAEMQPEEYLVYKLYHLYANSIPEI